MDTSTIKEVVSEQIPHSWFEFVWKSVTAVTGIGMGYLWHVLLPHMPAYAALMLACLVDWLSGMFAAYKWNKFETNRAAKFGGKVLWFSVLLLVLSFVQNAYVTSGWVVEGVMLPLTLIQVVSILKNLNRLGYITNADLKSFLSKIDRHKDD